MALERRMFKRGESLHAPALIDLEVLQVLHRYELRNDMTAARAAEVIDILGVFPLERYLHNVFIPRIWHRRGNLTAYDSAYVALAEALRAPLVTCDATLATAPGVRATVELFE